MYVPVFSKNEVAGRMTSANSAVSVRKMSCTQRKSREASAFRTLFTLGSERKGFSPIMYIPRISFLRAPFMISTTVRPASRSSGTRHLSSNFFRISGSSTLW